MGDGRSRLVIASAVEGDDKRGTPARADLSLKSGREEALNL
jgi:hypothetical protein